MSTTVTYKGSTLTTAENQTRTLLTSGKYLEDNVTIVDVSPTDGDNLSYGYVPIVNTAVVGQTALPNTGKVGSAKVGITLV